MYPVGYILDTHLELFQDNFTKMEGTKERLSGRFLVKGGQNFLVLTQPLWQTILSYVPPDRGCEKNMKKGFKKQILNRMSYLSGHLEGVKKMLEDDKYCIGIIKQNEAVVAAIKKVNQMLLENHLDTCVTAAIKGKSKEERRKKIKELLEIFENKEGR